MKMEVEIEVHHVAEQIQADSAEGILRDGNPQILPQVAQESHGATT